LLATTLHSHSFPTRRSSDLALQQGQVLLTRNHEHFEQLHRLVLGSGGHHSGIMTVRSEKDQTKRMKPGAIVSAIRKLQSAGVPIDRKSTRLNSSHQIISYAV